MGRYSTSAVYTTATFEVISLLAGLEFKFIIINCSQESEINFNSLAIINHVGESTLIPGAHQTKEAIRVRRLQFQEQGGGAQGSEATTETEEGQVVQQEDAKGAVLQDAS